MRNYAGGYLRAESGTAFVEVTQLQPHREYEFGIRDGLIARIEKMVQKLRFLAFELRTSERKSIWYKIIY